MLLEKYKPRTIAGIVGNRLQAGELKRAVAGWKRESIIVLSGPPGCGKTLALELVAQELGYEIADGVLDDLLAASRQSSIWARGKILVGDLDADVAVGDASKLAKDSTWPVVFVTCDIYQRSLVELRKSCTGIIQFQKAGISELAGFLSRVCKAEGVACNERAAYELAQRSDGDVRFALIALESLNAVDSKSLQDVDKDRIERVFDMLDAVFRRTHKHDIDIDSLFSWIVENLDNRYSGSELSQAYRCVAAASRFQRFGLDKYSKELIGLMPVSHASTPYRPPRWANLSAPVTGVHCSAKKSRAYLQVFNRLQKKERATIG